MKPIFIIEHLEKEMWPWCIMEYESISKIIGPVNLWFTNISSKDVKKIQKYGKIFTKSVTELNLNMGRVCVLDPLANKVLEYKETKEFDYYVFGGILGEEKLNGRTKKELTHFLKNANERNIGKDQFSTDNAVFVTHKIINGTDLENLKIQKTIEITINKVESIILPYSYPLVNDKPRISPKLVAYLKNKKDF